MRGVFWITLGHIAGIIKVLTPKSGKLGESEINGHDMGKVQKLLCGDFAYMVDFNTC